MYFKYTHENYKEYEFYVEKLKKTICCRLQNSI